jgi:hypothetical protein
MESVRFRLAGIYFLQRRILAKNNQVLKSDAYNQEDPQLVGMTEQDPLFGGDNHNQVIWCCSEGSGWT